VDEEKIAGIAHELNLAWNILELQSGSTTFDDVAINYQAIRHVFT
jgi:hypothetical protein